MGQSQDGTRCDRRLAEYCTQLLAPRALAASAATGVAQTNRQYSSEDVTVLDLRSGKENQRPPGLAECDPLHKPEKANAGP